MKKYFPLIINRLISPQTEAASTNFITRYFQKRKLLKQFSLIWPEFTSKNIVQEAASMYGRLRRAIKIDDKVQILRICSIPIYDQYKQNPQQIKLLQTAYNIKLWHLQKVSSNYNEQQDERNKQEWLRAYIKFLHQDKGKIVNKIHIIQRRITDESVNPVKKWYFYKLQQ